MGVLTCEKEAPNPKGMLSNHENCEDQQRVQLEVSRVDGWIQPIRLYEMYQGHHEHHQGQLQSRSHWSRICTHSFSGTGNHLHTHAHTAEAARGLLHARIAT